MTAITLRPDTTFVLSFDHFTHKARGGYLCSVFNGQVIKSGPSLCGADALSYLAAHPDTAVSVLHV